MASNGASRRSMESMEEGQGEESPSLNVETVPVQDKPRFHPSLYILNWIFFSNITIIFNKWLIDTAGFRYPILLTAWHLVFATVATQILARTTRLLDSRHDLALNRRLYVRTILPIGIMYSGSLVFSNIVYLYLSVAFIQMLKSFGPVAVLLTSWVWGVASPSWVALGKILLIVFGVGLASFGEIQFSMVGFVLQLMGTLFEAVRMVMIQVMLSGEGLRMDPLVGLYYYAPACAVLNVVVGVVAEGQQFQWGDVAKTGFGVLFLNAFVAFFLNIASVFLIGKTSGLVMSLSGILKNILLVAASVLIWGTQISLLQVLGYTVALVGLILYSAGYDQLRQGWLDAKTWAAGALNYQAFEDKARSAAARKDLVLGAVSLLIIVFLLSVWHMHDLWGGQAARAATSVTGSS